MSETAVTEIISSEPPPRVSRGGGGLPARRAIVRWAWRLLRREWRQQTLVIALLALTVAIAVGGATAAYNAARPQSADYGTADHRIEVGVSDSREGGPEAAFGAQELDAYLLAAEDRFGAIDMIGRHDVQVPGSTDTVELRSQDPGGPYGGPMLALREGRYPTRAGEVAVTDEVAETFQLDVGGTLDLEDTERTVVGLAENPGDLDDEFALVSPTASAGPDRVTILVTGSEDEVDSFRAEHERGELKSRSSEPKEAAGTGALAASTVVLLLVGLVAAASFVVVAQRRLRQLGMLAAIGATRKHLRLVVVANGAAVGAVAALLGAATGLAAWIGFAPRLAAVTRHRMDRFDIPWWLVAAGMALAVAAAALASWWPARTMARVPVTRALSGRPPRPRAVRRSLVLAIILIAGGVTCLMKGIDVPNDEGNPLLTIAGVLAVPLGIVMLSPLAVRMLRPAATRLPVASRLALRDLARYQARSGAALAAISLGLGISVAIVIAAAARQDSAGEGNLSDRQLLIRTGEPDEGGWVETVPDHTPAELEQLASAVDQMATTVDDATVVALEEAVDPTNEAFDDAAGGDLIRPPVGLGRLVGDTTGRWLGPLYVATPEVLGHFELEPASVDPSTEVLTHETGALIFTPRAPHLPIERVQNVELSGYLSAPRSLITSEAVRRHGWTTTPSAWFVEAMKPLTSDQVATIRELAADADLTVEARGGQQGLARLRSGATAAAVLLGLGILAMTVGLIRGEAATDLRTLAATGASSRVRRTITGVTAGTLAFLGALLGTAGAYAAMAAGYSTDIDQLLPVPVPELLVIALGLPLLAAAAGWLLAGREPSAMARTPIE